jgi:tetratricopeptide (TPR) repeat protein
MNLHEENLKLIQSLMDCREYSKAFKLSNESFDKFPNTLVYKRCMAFCCGMLGDLHRSKKLWLELIEDDPYSEESLMNLSDVEFRLGRLDACLGILKLACEYHPESSKPWLSMSRILLNQQKFSECVSVSLEAIQRNPQSADGFQNLGSAFYNLAKFNEAKHSFETALQLNPTIRESQISLATILYKQDKAKEAIVIFENLINSAKPNDRVSLNQIKWDSSLAYLRVGNLKKGWEYYELGLNADIGGNQLRRPQRSFNAPRWSPKSDSNAPMLLWREQGIGDEFLFLTCLQDLLDIGSKPIIETDARVINIIQQNFPTVVVREAIFASEYPYNSPYNDFHSQIPMGSLLQHFRSNLESFPNRRGYIKPDETLIAKWKYRLDHISKNKKIIGISWKGSISDPIRMKKYSELSQWKLLFECEDIEIVNLQYGDCESEIILIEEALGIKIHRWPDLNLKDDLDDVFALLFNLDQIVCISTSVWMFAASVGVPVSLLLHAPHWTMFNQAFIPFFPHVECKITGIDEQIHDLLPDVVKQIKKTRAHTRVFN